MRIFQFGRGVLLYKFNNDKIYVNKTDGEKKVSKQK